MTGPGVCRSRVSGSRGVVYAVPRPALAPCRRFGPCATVGGRGSRRESGNNSVVECDLAKVEVAGSNPVSRSNLRSLTRAFGWQAEFRSPPSREGGLTAPRLRRHLPPDRRRSQVVRQRSAKPPSPVQIRAAPPNFQCKFKWIVRQQHKAPISNWTTVDYKP